METRHSSEMCNQDDLIFRVKKAVKPYFKNTGNFDVDFETALENFYDTEPYYFGEWTDEHMKHVSRIIRLARAAIKNEIGATSKSFGWVD